MKSLDPRLRFQTIDHIHVDTPDRARAALWYERVLGLLPIAEFLKWAADDGPLFLSNAERTVCLARFERPGQPTRSTIAFRVDAEGFLAWRRRLQELLGECKAVDHDGSWSLYSTIPTGTRSRSRLTSMH